jgi:integrase/recombinase XerD
LTTHNFCVFLDEHPLFLDGGSAMFDQLFERASTIARHATAPFAEERIRYLDYCGQRGDSHAWKLRKADDLLWIARKLSTRTDLQVTIDEVRALVANGSDRDGTGGPKLYLLSTRKRLIGQACAWLRYLGYLREPVEAIPFGSRLDEYCDWAKHERGLSEASIDRFRRTIRLFLRWYGPLGQPLARIFHPEA